jgi:molybdenum cofactor guanylyltransferase
LRPWQFCNVGTLTKKLLRRTSCNDESFFMSENITGLILAGGQGRRMGGQDKGLVPYAGKPLIEHVLDTFSSQVDELIISANRNISTYSSYGYPVLSDDETLQLPAYSGPLTGIVTALNVCQTEWLACIPCDAVSLPENLVAKLHHHAKLASSYLAIVDDGERQQPLYNLIHKRLYADLHNYLLAGERRVMQWIRGNNATLVDFSGQRDVFLNVNQL